jgi:hypothetical protein
VLPSLRLGRYVVEGLLGPGGVTETYLARLPAEPGENGGGLFALKLLRQDRVPPTALPEVARRFVTAGQRLRDFQRPGFGKVVDVCGDPDHIFIVTDLVPGHDLAKLLELSRAEAEGRTGVDPALVGLLGAEIARLLHLGHAAKPGLHHLGLAPGNVIVTDQGEVVLLDPGIAALLRSRTEQPPERGWFVAPELDAADAATLDDRAGVAADLYSLGALLHFLLTGQPPSFFSKVAPAVPSLDIVPGLSPKLGTILRNLLARAPADRPDSAAGLVDRLAGGVDGVRQRQRLIADGLHRAEKEARDTLLRARGGAVPPDIKLVRPADSGTGEAMAHANLGPGRRRNRWRSWAAVCFAGGGLTALVVSFAWSTGLRLDRARPTPAEWPQAYPQRRPPDPGEQARKNEPQAVSREQVLALLAGRLVAETVPPGATVWVDGVAKGTTFTDLEIGPGKHRVVLTLAGHRSFREEVDTGRGAILRRKLAPAPPNRGGGFVRVECQTVGKYPILIDDEETGDLCPSLRIPAAVGKHAIGIYLPAARRVVTVEVNVEAGPKPALAKFSE